MGVAADTDTVEELCPSGQQRVGRLTICEPTMMILGALSLRPSVWNASFSTAVEDARSLAAQNLQVGGGVGEEAEF